MYVLNIGLLPMSNRLIVGLLLRADRLQRSAVHQPCLDFVLIVSCVIATRASTTCQASDSKSSRWCDKDSSYLSANRGWLCHCCWNYEYSSKHFCDFWVDFVIHITLFIQHKY